MKKRGFTLIELLVVIAVIGILAAIVLAALGSARDKGNDAKIQEQLASMRAAAEIYYTSHGNSYGQYVPQAGTTACTNPPQGMFNDVNSGLKNLSNPSNYPPPANDSANLFCGATNPAYNQGAAPTQWAVSAKLNNGEYWCVDSSGKSEEQGIPSIDQCQ